jgi:hypothetical protein
MESLQRCEDASALAPVETAGTAPLTIPARVQQALTVLVEAYHYALDLDLDPWDFAVELPTLRPLGLTNSDCRWLIGRGWVECGFELTLAGDERRSFRRSMNLKLSKRSCLVLTESGVVAAGGKLLDVGLAELTERLRSNVESTGHRAISFPEVIASAASDAKPIWDRDRQQLRIGKIIVKQFKVPAANQETVLAAFQEEEWPPRIDDPLSPQAEQDPKRRLHDTINSLNRNQKHPLLRFLGDGSGQGVRWEFYTNGREPHQPR